MGENKIPCGGFRIGDGLTMEGDTLKSLGGAYVKVKTNDYKTFEFMDDSPLKTFDEIMLKSDTSPITLLVYSPEEEVYSFFLERRASDGLIFCMFLTLEDTLNITKVSIDSDNKITFSTFGYTLTPAT